MRECIGRGAGRPSGLDLVTQGVFRTIASAVLRLGLLAARERCPAASLATGRPSLGQVLPLAHQGTEKVASRGSKARQ
jgi:hypothetical protein